MQPEEADPAKLGFDPFDVTKVWPRGQFPMQEYGKLVRISAFRFLNDLD